MSNLESYDEPPDYWTDRQIALIDNARAATLKAIVDDVLPDLFDIASSTCDLEDDLLEQVVADVTAELRGLL